MKKHYGKILGTNSNVVVVFMTIPNDKAHCLVVNPDKLKPHVRDEFLELVFSDSAQRLQTIHDLLYRTGHPDGGSMLEQFHKQGQLERYPTTDILMTPIQGAEIVLAELNKLIEKMSFGIENIPDEVLEEKRNSAQLQLDAQNEESIAIQSRNLLIDAKELEEQAKLLMREAEKKRAKAAALQPKPKTQRKKKVENVNETTS